MKSPIQRPITLPILELSRQEPLMKYTRFAKLFTLMICVVCALNGTARAASLQFEAFLEGLQEVPPNVSPAFGFADLSLDSVTGAVTVNAGSNYSDLLGGSIGASLNGPAAPGSNAGVLLSLTLDNPGATTGTISGGGTLAAGNIADMIAGNTYINIRSQVFPSGEIRGQLLAVPEPSTLLLAGLGMIGCAIAGRRSVKNYRD
ncbi:MAG TPA: CHRD domain-containing protein [Pirellulales bacterium]